MSDCVLGMFTAYYSVQGELCLCRNVENGTNQFTTIYFCKSAAKHLTRTNV